MIYAGIILAAYAAILVGLVLLMLVVNTVEKWQLEKNHDKGVPLTPYVRNRENSGEPDERAAGNSALPGAESPRRPEAISDLRKQQRKKGAPQNRADGKHKSERCQLQQHLAPGRIDELR